jgi:hypothetical protein
MLHPAAVLESSKLYQQDAPNNTQLIEKRNPLRYIIGYALPETKLSIATLTPGKNMRRSRGTEAAGYRQRVLGARRN